MQQHAVVLERERPLWPRTGERRDPRRQLGLAVRATKARIRSSSSSVTAGYQTAHALDVREARAPRDRRARAAGARRRRPRSPSVRRTERRPEPRSSRKPGDSLGVVAVRATLEERECRIRESAHTVQRCRVGRHELRQPVAANRGRRRQRVEQRELPARLSPAGSSTTCSTRAAKRSTVRTKRASPRSSSTGSVGARSTSSRAPSRSSTQPIGVSRSCGRSRSIAPETISRSIARVIAT